MQDPKQFSHAGKLKSLPWRLSILLHSWTQACRHSFAEENVELPWSRELPRNVVELSRTIFDYLSLQSQLLAPSSDLLAVLDQAGLRESCAQRYPSLLLLLETNTLPRELLPDQVPLSDTFPMWWSGLNPDAKLYSLLTAHWILTSTTTAVVGQGTCVKKIHSKDTGALLPRDTNKAHCQSAFLLLQYTQLAWLVKKPGAAPRLRKRSYPPVGPAAVAFSNLLHEFRQKNAGGRTEYNAQCVTVTDSLKKTCKNELAIPEPSSFETGTMDTALQILHEYIEEANPFQHVAKVLNIRSSGRAPPSQHPELEASGAPALAAGASIAPALFLPASIHMLAAGSSSAQALLHPLSLDMVPSLVLAFHHADPECRDLLAWCLLRQQFPTKQVTERDCNFVFAKLLCQAPHMLADRVVLPTDIHSPPKPHTHFHILPLLQMQAPRISYQSGSMHIFFGFYPASCSHFLFLSHLWRKFSWPLGSGRFRQKDFVGSCPCFFFCHFQPLFYHRFLAIPDAVAGSLWRLFSWICFLSSCGEIFAGANCGDTAAGYVVAVCHLSAAWPSEFAN